MNKVVKGNKFELLVYSKIEELLANDDFLVNSKNSKIFLKKSYFSKDRNKDIIVDISIEIGFKDAEKYSFLIVFECKDYSKPVPVDDIEEFHSKLQQIAGANVKGIFVSTADFQSSFLSFARSKGIGVIRILPENKLEHVAYNKGLGGSNIFKNILDKIIGIDILDSSNRFSESCGFNCIYKRTKYNSLSEFLYKFVFDNYNCHYL